MSPRRRATSQGDFHEALNFAAIHKLPVLFVIQNNGWAISVPVEEQTAGGSLVEMAKGYQGMSVYDVDGTDYQELSKAFQSAIAKARASEGPSLIMAHVPRLAAHSNSDDPKKYRSLEAESEDFLRDPLVILKNG